MIASMAADSIGTRIKKRRQALGFRSQQALADRIGVNRTTVSDWESDRYFPGRFQGALEAVLGIRLDEPEPEIPPEIRRQVAALTPLQRERVRAWLTDLIRREGEDGEDHHQEAPL